MIRTAPFGLSAKPGFGSQQWTITEPGYEEKGYLEEHLLSSGGGVGGATIKLQQYVVNG